MKIFHKNPCELACVFFGYVVVVYSWFVVLFRIVLPWYGFNSYVGILHFSVFNTLCILALSSQVMAMTSDPGFVPLIRDEEQQPKDHTTSKESNRFCKRCKIYKPAGAHHCSVCKRCVLRLDHHCPWIAACVGAYNLKFFLLYLMYVFALSFYSIAISVARIVYCSNNDWVGCALSVDDNSALVTVVLVGMLMFLAILFGMFVLAMYVDQVINVSTSHTYIDRLQTNRADPLGIHRHKITKNEGSFWEGLTEVYGERFALTWLLPVQRNSKALARSRGLPTNELEATMFLSNQRFI